MQINDKYFETFDKYFEDYCAIDHITTSFHKNDLIIVPNFLRQRMPVAFVFANCGERRSIISILKHLISILKIIVLFTTSFHKNDLIIVNNF